MLTVTWYTVRSLPEAWQACLWPPQLFQLNLIFFKHTQTTWALSMLQLPPNIHNTQSVWIRLMSLCFLKSFCSDLWVRFLCFRSVEGGVTLMLVIQAQVTTVQQRLWHETPDWESCIHCAYLWAALKHSLHSDKAGLTWAAVLAHKKMFPMLQHRHYFFFKSCHITLKMPWQLLHFLVCLIGFMVCLKYHGLDWGMVSITFMLETDPVEFEAIFHANSIGRALLFFWHISARFLWNQVRR